MARINFSVDKHMMNFLLSNVLASDIRQLDDEVEAFIGSFNKQHFVDLQSYNLLVVKPGKDLSFDELRYEIIHSTIASMQNLLPITDSLQAAIFLKAYLREILDGNDPLNGLMAMIH